MKPAHHPMDFKWAMRRKGICMPRLSAPATGS